MKQRIKGILYSVAPKLMTAVQSARARALSHRVVKTWGCPAITQKLIGRFGPVVRDGTFAGLKLGKMSQEEHLGPYLLGIYERELEPAWRTVLEGRYDQILDVGAKFGYYAVGLAKRFPQADVVAFDTDWWARKAIREMAELNAVNNVRVKGFCSPEWLTANVGNSAFILSDCEGYETTLFPDLLQGKLATTTLIIETHDNFVPGVSDQMRKVFEQSHFVYPIASEAQRSCADGDLDFLTPEERTLACQDAREPQLWLLCLPRSGPNKGLQFKMEARPVASE